MLLLLLVASSVFADTLVLDNRASYPKMAIQWALSAKEVDEGNKALIQGLKLNPSTMNVLTKPGKITLTIPKSAEYFRVLAWSKSDGEPDFVTNWVDIVPNKTYALNSDHLVPTVLMLGSGC